MVLNQMPVKTQSELSRAAALVMKAGYGFVVFQLKSREDELKLSFLLLSITWHVPWCAIRRI